MSGSDHVLVVGGSASGLSTAEALRRGKFDGSITVIGAEDHAPYDRPPLSKQVLSGAWEPSKARLRTDDHLAGLDADFVFGDRAVALDTATRTVRTVSGKQYSAESIVIATGARPRMLPGQGLVAGVHVLRTLDDSLALKSALIPGSRVVVVGDGVLGCEIAATASSVGAAVTLTGPQPAPMAAQVGTLVSRLLAELHTDHAVTLRLETAVAGVEESDGRASGVRLKSGETIPADVVVVAIGAVLATEWLDGSGLTVDNGVVCDSRCRAAENIYAVGDLARWHHEKLDRLVRLENRTNATEQAASVAATILGDDEPYVPIPYFWTDQFDVKLQVYGFLPAGADVDVVEGDVSARRFVARYRENGVTTGILGWNMPKQARMRRQEIVDALG